MNRKESLAVLAMALAGFVVVALFTFLLKGSVDWVLALIIAINYGAISLIYWRWKSRS